MRLSISAEHPLHRFFSGLVEHAMHAEAGIADPGVVGYLAELLIDFIHSDRIFGLRDEQGRPLNQVADMLARTQAAPAGEVHRHIGDFTLFWVSVYPENLRRLCARGAKDYVIDYFRQGKHSYALASELSREDGRPPASLLRRLSEQYECCAYGLGMVREQVRQAAESSGSAGKLLR